MEWYLPDPAVSIRQGDMLISRDPKDGEIGEMCVVLTADCDISKGKFGRQLACLRVITHRQYIRHVWAEKKLEKLKKEEKKNLHGQLAKWQTLQLGYKSKLTEDAALSWVLRSSSEEICEALGLADKDRRKLTAALDKFRTAFNFLNKQADSMATYSAFKSAILGIALTEARENSINQAKKEELPEDVFLLPAFPLIQETPCVVMLRELIGVPHESVCARSTDADTPEKFLRVGRLQPTFKYAVSQAFGSLYAKIGLPEEYELRCKDVAANLDDYNWDEQC